jgi:hypothetical protein
MLPSHIVGTVIAKDHSRPFVLRVDTGLVELGRFTKPSPEQADLGSMERAAVGKQVRGVVGKNVQRVVLGDYQCPSCERWVDVIREPDRWDVDRCVDCG